MESVIKTLGKLGLVALTGMASPLTMAEDAGWYGGFNIGQSRAKIDDERITSSLLGGGFTSVSIVDDDRDTGYKLFGGYQFNRYFALESGYFDLGQFGFTATTTPAGTFSGDMKLKGLSLDAVGILPLTEKFSALGRAGVNYADTQDSFRGTGSVIVSNPDSDKRAANYKVGLGLQYAFTQALGMRAEAERYRINDAVGNKGDIDLLSLGLVFRFGGSKAHTARSEAPVEAVAAAPVLVIVPVAKKTQQYCSILDLTFEINQDGIQRDDKERLGVVGTFMKKYPDTTAVIEGHADNVGTPEHNMELSQQRAESVVSYLTDSFTIAPSRLTAVGYGNTRPVADNNSEEGQRANRRINAVIACAADTEGLTVAAAKTTMALEMDFDPSSAEVQPQYRDELRKVAKFMKANPAVNATVEGHAGKFLGTGSSQVQVTPEMAMEVSQLRATNVVNYLADNLGVERSRLSTAAYGQTRRINYGTTLEGQQENRRVNIIFTYPKK